MLRLRLRMYFLEESHDIFDGDFGISAGGIDDAGS